MTTNVATVSTIKYEVTAVWTGYRSILSIGTHVLVVVRSYSRTAVTSNNNTIISNPINRYLWKKKYHKHNIAKYPCSNINITDINLHNARRNRWQNVPVM
jgi:hypothetical protein